jgi:hypothetical protein
MLGDSLHWFSLGGLEIGRYFRLRGILCFCRSLEWGKPREYLLKAANMVEKKLKATIPVYLCLHLLTSAFLFPIGSRKQCQNRLLLFLRWILKVETSPWQTARVQHKYKGSHGLSLKVHSRHQDSEDYMNIDSTITFASYSCYGSCQPVEALPGFCCF